MMNNFELPDIFELSDSGNDPKKYLQDVYDIFHNDFVSSKPVFRGIKLGLKRNPIIDGKEYTFYHMTHSGDIENERIPDMRRMERMPWPRPMIDECDCKEIKVWENIRRGQGGTKKRILIFHESANYLVVLDNRIDFILPWTAYHIRDHKKVKLLKEYDNFIKNLK